MNRNQVTVTKKQVSGLKKQVEKYDRLQTGQSFLGYSKKRHLFVIKNWRKK